MYAIHTFLQIRVHMCRGVRCTTDILPGTYVADYIGEIMNEDEGAFVHTLY